MCTVYVSDLNCSLRILSSFVIATSTYAGQIVLVGVEERQHGPAVIIKTKPDIRRRLLTEKYYRGGRPSDTSGLHRREECTEAA